MRKSTGSMLFIEMSITGMFIVMAAFLALDLGIIIFAAGMCSESARDCARSAGQTWALQNVIKVPPNNPRNAPYQAALAALESHPVDGFMLKNLKITSFEYHGDPLAENPPRPDAPYVSVATSLEATLPVPIYFFGAKLGYGSGRTMNLNNTYVYPIVNAQPVVGKTGGSYTSPSTTTFPNPPVFSPQSSSLPNLGTQPYSQPTTINCLPKWCPAGTNPQTWYQCGWTVPAPPPTSSSSSSSGPTGPGSSSTGGGFGPSGPTGG